MDHSYEEIRTAALDILAGREKCRYEPTQYGHLRVGVAEVLQRRESTGQTPPGVITTNRPDLSRADQEIFQEVFWDLFRQNIITLGSDAANLEFPWFRVSLSGKRILENQRTYFFHDVSSYTKVLEAEVPRLDAMTLLYLQEAMQAFRAGCRLSASVMLGVAAEHSFLLLVEDAVRSDKYGHVFASVMEQRTVLQQLKKFRNILDQHKRDLPPGVLEDLDTNFLGIQSIIRIFRNEAGHPTGKIVDREQVYVLLHLFVPYCKKIYELRDFFGKK